MDINKNLISRNHTAQKRGKADIKYIVVHYVGALGDAKANTDYYKNNDVSASADFFVGHGGDIWQANDYYNYYSWHCGGGRQGSSGGAFYGKCLNSNSVGIEMCVKKTSTKTMQATDKDWYFTDATVKAAAELVAYLMAELDIDIDHVIRHYDVNGKICPNPFVYDTGAVSWDEFKKMCSGGTQAATETKWYRVRKSWTDADSQLGAYAVLDNAKVNCPAGYTVYDADGKAVYTNTFAGTGTQVSEFAGLPETEAAARLLEICKPVAELYNLLPSVAAAQTILESGYCTTELAQKANNVCGMKCTLSGNTWGGSTWDGVSKVTIRTAEQDKSGNVYYINANFRKYPCIEDSIKDRCAYLLGALNGNSLRYAGITDCKDYKSQITLIKNGGYATDVNYIGKICDIITRYGLDKYDTSTGDILPETDEPWYRIRKAWTDSKSQAGAYHDLDKAKACADKHKGYYVFDEDGNAIYPAEAKTNEQISDAACNWAVSIANDNSHGYNNTGNGWGPEYNCIGLVMSAYTQAGLDLGKCNIDKMPDRLIAKGFEDCTAEISLKSGKGATKGTILWMLDSTGKHGHTELYLGDGLVVGARNDDDGKAGDGSGNEITVSDYIDFGWQRAFRLPGTYTTTVKSYRVQAGAFTKKANANNLIAKLKKSGFAAVLKQESGNYIVQLGLFENKTNADNLAAAVKKKGFDALAKEI